MNKKQTVIDSNKQHQTTYTFASVSGLVLALELVSALESVSALELVSALESVSALELVSALE